MKKVTIVIVLLAFLFKSNAQEELSYGPIVGISMTAINKSMTKSVSDYTVGYQIGANVNYRIIELVGVSFSASYATMGGNSFDVTNISFPGEAINDYKRVDMMMHTIDLNLLANVYIPITFGPIQPKVLLGVGNAYNLSAKATKYKDGAQGESTSTSTEDFSDRFAAYDFAAIGGLGVELEILGFNTSIDARYRVGFTDINNVALKPELYNSSFALVLGVNF